jgi:hypothetical protein
MGGNLAVQRLLRSGAIQDKLSVSEPSDPYEEEADRVAQQVVRMPAPFSVASGVASVQRQTQEEDDVVQTKPVAATPQNDFWLEALDRGGQFPSPAAREFFGRVRVQTDSEAAALAPDKPPRRPVSFPHAKVIHKALNAAIPLTGVVDVEQCNVRGTPAYTDGTMTYFAAEAPNMHVAAHEAAHQLQHAGLTGDAGLGAEGHAGAFADAITEGKPVAHLIGNHGERVAPAVRSYTLTDRAGRWRGMNPGAAVGKLSETGETLTFHGKDAYAMPGLIASAGETLSAKQAGLRLKDGGAGLTVEVPGNTEQRQEREKSGKASESKQLSRLEVEQVADPGSKEFFGDCGRLAREMMGPTGKDAPASVVCQPGGVPQVINPGISKKAAKEQVALMLFLDRKMRETPGYDKLPEEEKRKIAEAAKQEYSKLSETEKEEFIKKELKAGRVPRDKAEALGIDEFAQPGVGEAFTIVRAGPHNPNEYPYHWAAVIMVAGPDRVTFENTAESGHYDGKNTKWYLETYGPALEGQSYHDDWKSGFGPDAHTVTARTQPPTPANVADIPGKSTADLIAWYDKATPDERYYLTQELDKRTVSASVTVIVQQDWSGDDEVFLTFSASGKTVKTDKARIPKGTTQSLSVRVGGLLPMDNPLTIKVWEYDLIDPNDLIGTITWDAPYPEKSQSVTGDGANYQVTLTIPR